MQPTRLPVLASACGAAAVLLFAGCAGPRSAPASSPTAVVNAPVVVAQGASYGTVSSISTVDRSSPRPGAGAVLGAVVGGVLGHQVGGGTGRDIATVAGAVAGGVAGHRIAENRAGNDSVYRVEVRFDDGHSQSFDFNDLNGLRVGERVRWENNQLQRL